MSDETGWVRIYPPPDDPDEIARELFQTIGRDLLASMAGDPAKIQGNGEKMCGIIAAALRLYGDAKLEQAVKLIETPTGLEYSRDEVRALRLAVAIIRSLKFEDKP